VTLDEARAAMPFEVFLPPKFEIEDVFLLEFLGLDGVVVRTGTFDLWQFRATPDIYLGKGGTAVRVEETTVNGRFAYWVTGGPRILGAVTASGREINGVAIETDSEALVWESNGITYRLEGDLSLEQALAIVDAFE
jgi:hypothetical protein